VKREAKPVRSGHMGDDHADISELLHKPYAKRRPDEPRSHFTKRMLFIANLTKGEPGLQDERIEALSNCYANKKFLRSSYSPEVEDIIKKYDPEAEARGSTGF